MDETSLLSFLFFGTSIRKHLSSLKIVVQHALPSVVFAAKPYSCLDVAKSLEDSSFFFFVKDEICLWFK